MNEVKQRLKDISEIRSLMENSTKFLSLSGLSGVSAGIIALIGATVAWYYLGATWEYERDLVPRWGIQFYTFFCLNAGIVLILALLSASFFSIRKARRMKLPVWNKTAVKLVISMLVPLVAGAIFSFIQVQAGVYKWVTATTLLFYGMALLSASKYTLREIRYLGLSEVIIGLLCAYWSDFGLYFWALGFGVLHIVYGILMYLKYER